MARGLFHAQGRLVARRAEATRQAHMRRGWKSPRTPAIYRESCQRDVPTFREFKGSGMPAAGEPSEINDLSFRSFVAKATNARGDGS